MTGPHDLALHPRWLTLLAELGLAQETVARGRKLESLTGSVAGKANLRRPPFLAA